MSFALFNLRFSIFRFCATRWVEDRHVAERPIEVWGPCVKLIRHYESLSKSKRPTNKFYKRLVSHYTDLLVPVKFQFFVSVITIFEPYLSIFQMDSPMIPFMFTELENIYNELLRLVFRQSCLEKPTSIANRLRMIGSKTKKIILTIVLLILVLQLNWSFKKQMSSQN